MHAVVNRRLVETSVRFECGARYAAESRRRKWRSRATWA